MIRLMATLPLSLFSEVYINYSDKYAVISH
jgi:hypothetical protein